MILSPPAVYDHPYVGPLIEWVMPAPKVDALCRALGGAVRGEQYQGCQFKLGDHCFIVVAEHVRALARRHEIAHCNGWLHP